MSPPSRTSSLRKYRQKRDFSKTPEPDDADVGQPGSLFVIQKHAATRLHYDLRLQIGDALASWAVPKGPSTNPADKRLAVRVEDHPVSYAEFEGNIPRGQYGAGSVIVWDRGVWSTDAKDPKSALRRGRLDFSLDGERLRGEWTLTRLKGKKEDDDRENWLLIKRTDEYAADNGPITDAHTTSITSGRTLEEVARTVAGRMPAKKPKKTARTREAVLAPEAEARDRPGAKPGPMADDYSPQLCTLAPAAPPGDNWLHEIKYDGYRLLARKSGGDVRLTTRNGHDWTHRFKPIASALRAVTAEAAVIDGEAVIMDDNGRSSFQMLQRALKGGSSERLAFMVFDLLHLDGVELARTPLAERKKMLRAIVPGGQQGIVRFSEHVAGRGPEMHREACRLGLEGIVSKKADAPYSQNRSPNWLKVKCARRQEFVVIGWTDPSGSRKRFGSLLLGAHDDRGELHYTGRVGTGFDRVLLDDIADRLARMERKTCPADHKPTAAESRNAHWVRPELVVEVEFSERTDDGRLRHPVFQGIREDKPADEVRFEITGEIPTNPAAKSPSSTPENRRRPEDRRQTSTPARRSGAVTEVLGVRVSSPDRLVFPDAEVTKGDLAAYFGAVVDHLLPHLEGRPLSVVRCPQGRAKACFFQKHFGETFDDPVRPIRVPEKAGHADYLSVDSPDGVITLVQFGVIEIHPWGARAPKLDKPDLLTFDLDPGPDVAWPDVRTAAVEVRDRLAAGGLESFVKTTGGKGLHVVVPLRPHAGWDEAKSFCAGLARRMSRDAPSRYVATASKQRRDGKIFVDYLRNGRGATSVAPFSARARVGAPVATPIRWDELGRLPSGDHYTVANVPRRLASLRSDPWDGFAGHAQRLTPAVASAVP
jgi:bifunctional non-homologous end joining protein LigD